VRRSLYTFSLISLSASVSGVALAQAPAEPVENADNIIVTAQKREERQIDVPVTISAITGERLRQIGVSDLDELANFVPGLNIQEQSRRGDSRHHVGLRIGAAGAARYALL
jgi:iron complex outermembrane recepter protein